MFWTNISTIKEKQLLKIKEMKEAYLLTTWNHWGQTSPAADWHFTYKGLS